MFQVSIQLSYNNEFLCGGTILDSKFIVTVASCMYYNWGGILPPIIVTISAGMSDLNDTTSDCYEVEGIMFHDLYDKLTLDFNIALIQV